MVNFKPNPKDSIAIGIWAVMGLFSWQISIYVFRFWISPLVPPAVGFVKKAGASNLVVITLETLLSHIAEYVLYFGFALALGYFSKSTKFRIFGFVIAANAVALYYHLLQLFGYAKHYSHLPTSAIVWITQGLISILIVSPFFTIMGSRAGNTLKKGRAASPPAGA